MGYNDGKEYEKSGNMIKIHNRFITAKIDKLGAEIKSIVCQGKEILWQGENQVGQERPQHFFLFAAVLKTENTYIMAPNMR